MSKEKPVLLQINVTANWGSTGKIAEQIGQMAIQQGWESFIAYGRKMNPSKSKLIRIGTNIDVYLHYALSRFLDAEGLGSKRATRNLIKEIERIKPDVIHLHNIHDHYLNYPILFKYLANSDIPVVWTQHDQWATTGHCPYNQVGCDRWTSQCHDCPVREKLSLDRSKRNYELKKRYFTSVKSMTIVSVSEWLNSQIEKSFLGIHMNRVVKNGVDIDIFKPVPSNVKKRYGLERKKIILGVASVWNDIKGLDDFIKLSAILPDEWIIVLVGTINKTVNSKNILNIQRTQNQFELAELYAAANVIISMSSSETFGLTIAEGLACGTPAIVYNNTAQPELVNEKTGMVVKPGDYQSILNSLSKFGVKNKEISIDCRKRSEEFFDKNKSYMSYVTLYSKLMGGGKFIILGVANPWSERKGLNDYIALSGLLPENVLIVLVGLSDEQRNNLPQNIIGMGPTQDVSELVMLYSMADIVMNLSYAETFGMTTVEGFACGTPSIVYRATASPELITPETGLIVEPGDIKSVAEAVIVMIAKGKDFYSDGCRKRAEICYNKANCFGAYTALYEEVISNR